MPILKSLKKLFGKPTVSIRADYKNKKVFAHINSSLLLFNRGITDALYEIGADNKRYARKLIKDKNKTGRIYTIKGQRHQSSAPGEPPANLTGNLAKNIDYIVRGYTQMEFGDKAKHGKFLENGTKNMKPRPHLSKTVKDRAIRATNSLRRAVDRRMNL